MYMRYIHLIKNENYMSLHNLFIFIYKSKNIQFAFLTKCKISLYHTRINLVFVKINLEKT